MSFKIFMIYHSHIDIGYTERQERITNYQADFIRQAVDCALSKKNNDRDTASKFKFTAEGFWAVEQYLQKYGEIGKKRLVLAAQSGCLELSATYLHNAELLDYNTYDWSIKRGVEFARDNKIGDLKVAMSADVNGLSWGHAQAQYDNGVRYYCTCINTHHGGAPFDKPLVPFYWETPDGNRLLVWNGLTYHKGNLLGLIPGWSVLGDVGIPGLTGCWDPPKNIKSVKQAANKRVHKLIDGLKKNNYPYQFLPIMAGGCFTDNNPIGDEHCDMVAEWNKLYGNEIEIVNATLSEFFAHLENNVKDIKTYRGEWNDWWTDGVLSTPTETNFFRKAGRLQRAILDNVDYPNYIKKTEIDELNYNLALYSEHTWGHSQSLSDPCKLIVRELDSRKARLAIEAYKIAKQLYNKLPKNNCKLQNKEKLNINSTLFDTKHLRFENVFYAVQFDDNGLKSLEYKDFQNIAITSNLRIGQPVYQVFPNGNRGVCAGFGYSSRGKLESKLYYGKVKKITAIENTSEKCAVMVEYEIEGASIFNTTFTMYIDSPRIDIKTQMLKNLELDPEGMYLALPLTICEGEWYLDKPKSLSIVGNQLPATCCDYYSCIRGVVLKGVDKSIVVNMYGSPLVTIGRIKLWEFTKEINACGILYSWQTNNKWETNFRCECSGIIENDYSIEVCNKNQEISILHKNDINIEDN